MLTSFYPFHQPFQVFVSFPYLTGQPLTPASTFAALSLMNLLMEPMYFVPMVASLLVNAFVGVSRLENFFMAPETERDYGHGRSDCSNGLVPQEPVVGAHSIYSQAS